MKSNVFARTAIRYIQSLLEVRLLKEAVVPFEMDGPEKPIPPVKASKAPKRKALRTISLRQIEIQKTDERIAAAVYQYQVDNDGEWGEIRFDFATGTAEIVRLAEWDTIKSNIFARAAIQMCIRDRRCPGRSFWAPVLTVETTTSLILKGLLRLRWSANAGTRTVSSWFIWTLMMEERSSLPRGRTLTTRCV